MINIKISNSLLNWIFECECEFVEVIDINKINTYIVFKPHRNPTSTGVHKITDGINIYQFIHLAENKMFDKNYSINPIMDGFVVFDVAKEKTLIQFGKGEKHRLGTLEQKLEALEWVVRNENTRKCLNCKNMVERLYCNHYNNYVVQLTNDEIKNCGGEY